MINNHAFINTERCIMCGKCIEVCPTEAQKYRNDEERVIELLNSDKKVILAIAPAFAGEFCFSTEQLLTAALKAGFDGISETALGAQIVTHFQRKMLKDNNKAVFSTACPAFVHLILKYFPEWKNHLSPLLSPLLAQCMMLKKEYGEDIAIVFVGPCLAKKAESDCHPELLDVSITFDEFEHLLQIKNIDVYSIEADKACGFIPIQSNGGAIYPIDGGMLQTITNLKPTPVTDTSLFHYTGVKPIIELIENDNFKDEKVFCEFLACDGGCINGSGIFDKQTVLTKKNKIVKYFHSLEHYNEEGFIKKYSPDTILEKYDYCIPVEKPKFSEKEKKVIFEKLGKYSEKDFVNCGSCGYDTCDSFAEACLESRAELEMCAVSMKKQAMKKLSAFMLEIPLGFCAIDKNKNIIECNYKFIKLSVDVDIQVDDKLVNRVVGTAIDKFYPIAKFVSITLKEKRKVSEIIQHESRIFNVTVFPFERGEVAGIIIQDITKPLMKKEVIVAKSQEVIKNNLKTVQKIAYLLGETAAETEVTLNEIIQAYNLDNKESL